MCNICGAEIAIQACICSKQVKFLGSNCLISHFQDSSSAHDLVSIEFGQIILESPSRLETYYKDLPRIYNLISTLENYSNFLDSLKAKAIDARENISSRILHSFEKVTSRLDKAKSVVTVHARKVSSYKMSLSQEGKDLLEFYQSKLRGNIEADYIQSLDINVDEISAYVESKIAINSNSQCRGERVKNESLESLISSSEYSIQREDLYSLDKDKKIEALKETILNYQLEINSKDQEIIELRHSIHSMKDMRDRYQEELSNNVTKREELEFANLCLNKEIEQIKASSKESIQNYRERNRKLKLDNKVLESELSNSSKFSNSINTLKKKLKAARELNTKNEHKIHILDKELSSLKRYKILQDSMNGLHSSVDSPIEICEDMSRYIFIPQYNTKRLLQIDAISGKAQVINMIEMSRGFCDTSTCVLENGDVICAGFNNPVSSHAYLLKSDNRRCIKLPDLSYPRYFVSLFQYKSYVYAFGGKNSKNKSINTVERLNLSNYTWETLPDMKYASSSLSCIEMNERIYLFNGSANIILYLDTNTLRFKEIAIENSETETHYGIAYKHNNRVYLLTSNYLQVYNLFLDKLHKYKNTNRYKRYSINNLISYDTSIYFYNHNTFSLEKLSISPSDPDRYKNSLSKFIYKTRVNTKDLHRIDVETSSIKSFNLSSYLHRNFQGTSLCILPNGDVFIAGFCNPIEKACYIFNSNSKSCARVADMPSGRYNICLYYYKDYVYAFGGRTEQGAVVNTAERFEVAAGRWSSLGNMIKPRRLASCVGVEHKIYIFGGESKSVEMYSIISNIFTITRLELYSDVVAVFVNNVIFVIGESEYTILNKDLVIYEQTKASNENSYNYTLGNIAVTQGDIYFYNSSRRLLELMKTQSRGRGIVVIG
jgi:hypothetical protein